nr:helix-turn-helix transcriptional regulator [Metabacillus crassostreae]
MIGATLKELRKELNISQEEISGRTGLDRTFISMLERDIRQPTITTIFLLAEALKLKPFELVKKVEEKYKGYEIKRDTY